MRLDRLVTTPVLAPLRQPFRTASGTVDRVPLLLIDVATDTGVTGRAYCQTYTPELLPALQATLQALWQFVQGETAAPRHVHALLLRKLRLWGARNTTGVAIGGLDMALWDAHAKARNEPLYATLGAAPRTLPAYHSVGLYDAAHVPAVAEEALAGGYAGLKIKLGFETLAQDLAAVHAARRVLGDGVALMVDYNQSLHLAEAMTRCHALDGEGLTWIEEPIAADDHAGYARLAAMLATPLQMGENFNGCEDLQRALATHACDCVMPDAQVIRGVTGWLDAAAITRAANVPMSSHMFVEASAHLLCATPTAHWLEHLDVAAPLLQQPYALVDGRILPPARPGLGLEWDADAVDRCRLPAT